MTVHGRLRSLLLAGAALGLAAAPAGFAKTLVFCAEGSPENFSPMLNTTGTTFAANRPIYSRLIEFKEGTTAAAARPGRELGRVGGRQGLHLPPAPRREVAQQRRLQADAGFQRRRRAVDASTARARRTTRTTRSPAASYDYYGDMGFAKLITAIDKVDDYTVQFTLTEPQAPFLADLAMDFAAIMSAEYADTLTKAGKPEQIDQQPIGTGPVLLRRLPARRHDPLSPVRRFLGAEGQAGRAGVLHQQGPGGAPGQAARQRVPGDELRRTGRPAGHPDRPAAAADAACPG